MPIKEKDKLINIHNKYMWNVAIKNSNNLLKYLKYVGLCYPAMTNLQVTNFFITYLILLHF